MTSEPGRHDRQARRAVVASMIGTTIEYYDFFVYGTAASLVFDKLFFPTTDSGAGLLLSLSTFAIAFVMRPVGAAIFGNLGDRVGRKRVLYVTIMVTGVGTVAIGLLPTYQQVGVLAPALLVITRLIQGIGLGGEVTGAWVMSIETAKATRRGAFGAFVNSGAGWGLLLSTLVLQVLTRMPNDQLLGWGWRIPFLLSALLVVVGLYIRLRLDESPEFAQAARAAAVRKAPILDAIRTGWRQMVLVALTAIGTGANFYVASVFTLSYGAHALGLSGGTIPSIILVMTVLVIVLIPAFGLLTDRVGAKAVFVAAAIGFVIAPFVLFFLLQTRNYGLMLLGFCFVFVTYSASAAAFPSFWALAFPTTIRYTGVGISNNIGNILGGSFAPLISAALFKGTGSWLAVACYIGGVSVISVVGGLLLRVRPDASVLLDGPSTGRPTRLNTA